MKDPSRHFSARQNACGQFPQKNKSGKFRYLYGKKTAKYRSNYKNCELIGNVQLFEENGRREQTVRWRYTIARALRLDAANHRQMLQFVQTLFHKKREKTGISGMEKGGMAAGLDARTDVWYNQPGSATQAVTPVSESGQCPICASIFTISTILTKKKRGESACRQIS